MNMNRKYVILLAAFTFFFSILSVNAASCAQGYVQDADGNCVVNCLIKTDESTCNNGEACYWDKTKDRCEFAYLAENPCSEPEILHVLHFIGYLLFIAKILVPLLIVGFATFDLLKAVIDKDEKSITKQARIVGIRIVSGIIVFLLPSIVYAVFSISSEFGGYKDNKYQTCADCLLKPTKGNCIYE